MTYRLIFTAFVLPVIFVCPVYAQVFELNEAQELSFDEGVYAFADSSTEISFEKVKASPEYFQAVPKSFLHFGFTKSVIWLKFRVRNNTPSTKWLLKVAHPIHDELIFYEPDGAVNYNALTVGDSYLFDKRPLAHRHFLFPFSISPGEEKTLYIRSQSKHSQQFPLSLIPADKLAETDTFNQLGIGIYYGMMVVMGLYNLFLFFSIRDRVYLIYVFSIFCNVVFFVFMNGHGQRFLTPENTYLSDRMHVFCGFLLGISALMFSFEFLQLKRSRTFKVLFGILALLSVFFLIGSTFNEFLVSGRPLTVMLLIISISTLSSGVISLRKGDRSARFFITAWAMYLIGGALFAAKTLELLPHNFFTQHTMKIGALMEVILLSFALADRYNALRKEKEKASQQLLENRRRSTEVLEYEVKKRTAELTNSKNALEKRNKDITSSIRYAKRIQQAVLGSKDGLRKLFPNAFIFLKPKDIVSGDFYWMADLPGRNLKIIIGADCTGHGVAGAFMTVMGSDFLNEIILGQGIVSPAAILRELDRKVIKATKSSTSGEQDIHDGMDMAVAVIDIEKKVLHYGGAKNALYLFSKRENYALHELKTSRYPIGSLKGVNKHFEDFKISYKYGDKLYLFSDGFQDQFGGEKGRKYLKKNFREFLKKTVAEPLLMQERLLEQELNTWKGERSQTDDILVIGVEL